MLVSSPVSKVIVEWQAPKLHGYDLIFFGVAAVTVVLALWHRRRLALYDAAVLAVTLAGSVRSSRGIVWFSLAVLVLAPTLLDGILGGREVPLRRRAGLWTSFGALAALAAVFVAVGLPLAHHQAKPVVAQPETWYEKRWPAAGAKAAARAAAGGGLVYPSDKHADWLLWKEPSLRGKVAYDVRFELLTGAQLDDVVRVKASKKDWLSGVARYRVIVLDPNDGKARIRTLERERGTRVLYKDSSLVVLLRANT